MEKFKNFWRKNKVLVVLGAILVVCFIAICVVVITYFFGGSDTVYGDRLKDIDKHPITEEFKNEYLTKLKEDKNVKDVSFDSKGRVIYIRIEYVEDYALVEAESKATASLTTFTDNILDYYDINITIMSEATENSDGFTLMGARNTGSDSIVWNNTTPAVESEEK